MRHRSPDVNFAEKLGDPSTQLQTSGRVAAAHTAAAETRPARPLAQWPHDGTPASDRKTHANLQEKKPLKPRCRLEPMETHTPPQERKIC